MNCICLGFLKSNQMQLTSKLDRELYTTFLVSVQNFTNINNNQEYIRYQGGDLSDVSGQ